MYKHHQVLSSARKDTLHGVSSKKSHLHRHKKNIKENDK